MAMSLEEIRLRQNPILTSLLLGAGQGSMIAEHVFPSLPHTLSSIGMVKVGDEAMRRYNLRRAPGAVTKRVWIKYEGVTYSVDQYSVEVPIPREAIREADESRKLNVGSHLDISRMAMATANAILGLDHEIQVGEMATNSAIYAAGHVVALSGTTKWSDPLGTPVTDIRDAAEVIRQKTGKRPNKLTLSALAAKVLPTNAEVRGYLPSTQMGPATLQQLAEIFNVKSIAVGDATYKDDAGTAHDVWGNNAILHYSPDLPKGSPDISLAEPAFGFTNTIEGHPFAETPYYEQPAKSWIYGATYERRPNVAYDTAAFLFQNPA